MVIPWVGFPLAELHQALRADVEGEVRRVHDAVRPAQMPGVASAGAALAVRRRAADGRGDASAHDPRRRPLRRSAAEAGRRAAPAGRAVEVRLQGRQVDRARSGSSRSSRSTRWQESAPQRVRLLREREPEVDHPRWSQATERRIGEFFKRKTLMFNGYGDQVAGLYAGMDLEEELTERLMRGVSDRHARLDPLGPQARGVRSPPRPGRLAGLGGAHRQSQRRTRSATSPTKPASGRCASSASRSRSRRCAG